MAEAEDEKMMSGEWKANNTVRPANLKIIKTYLSILRRVIQEPRLALLHMHS